jgi:serine/threonine-protein phosphatase 6 regulatory subunit 3
MENDPMLNSGYGYTGNMAPVRQVSVSLADMLKVLADNVESFNRLLTEPRSVVSVHSRLETQRETSD